VRRLFENKSSSKLAEYSKKYFRFFVANSALHFPKLLPGTMLALNLGKRNSSMLNESYSEAESDLY
jgi:hypothetical protein